MIKFIKNNFSFTLIGIVLFSLSAFIYGHFDDTYTYKNLAAPNISNNISFNDKLRFAAQKEAECISIGSSLTLNNLDSETIINSIQPISYLNLSSWGLMTKHTYYLSRIYSELYNPKVVIINTNIVDFQKNTLDFNQSDTKNYLRNKNSFWYHLKHFELQYYLRNFEFYKKNKNTRTVYTSLNYDKYGGVLFDYKDFNISKKRWNNAFPNIEIDTLSYIYLDSLCIYAGHQNIDLIFLQSPFREGLLDDINMQLVEQNTSKIDSIINSHDLVFIDGTKQIWKDSLFTDGIHFNKVGAKKFTEFCMQELENKKK